MYVYLLYNVSLQHLHAVPIVSRFPSILRQRDYSRTIKYFHDVDSVSPKLFRLVKKGPLL